MILTIQSSGDDLYESIEPAPDALGALIETGRDGSGPMIDVLEIFLGQREWHATDKWWPDHLLRVGVNAATGYGALVWVPLGSRVNSDPVSERVWVSAPSAVPAFEPEVPSGYQGNPFNSRSSTFVIPDVMTVLTNFSDVASGARPEGVPGFQAGWTARGNECLHRFLAGPVGSRGGRCLRRNPDDHRVVSLSDLRHLRIAFDEHGVYDIVCLDVSRTVREGMGAI